MDNNENTKNLIESLKDVLALEIFAVGVNHCKNIKDADKKKEQKQTK